MAVEDSGDASKKRKRSDRSKQGQPASIKRRRAGEADELETSGENRQNVKPEEPARESRPSNELGKVKGGSPASKAPTGVKDSRSEGAGSNGRGKDTGHGEWTLSGPRGGTYLQHDPQYSCDGRYLIAAKEHEVQILSLEHSVVEKTILAVEGSQLQAFAASSVNSEQVFVAWSNPSRVELWDWDLDHPAMIKSEVVSGNILKIAGANSDKKTDEGSVVLTSESDQWTIRMGDQILHQTKVRLNDLCVDDDLVIATGPHHLIVGNIPNESARISAFTSFEMTSTIVSASMRRLVGLPSKAGKSSQASAAAIALGTSTGEIFVYENIVLAGKSKLTSLPTARTLHWHRSAVQSLKWSPDGSYLVSGGTETVLVIWLMATGKKQFLPHLSAEIQNVQMAPNGTQYALSLADNSIMVLSTSELKPVFHFPDLQSQCTLPEPVARKKHDPKAKFDIVDGTRMRAAGILHPRHPNEVIMAVPADVSGRQGAEAFPSRPFLLSFDLQQHRYKHRQALTRNKVTDLNTGPGGKQLQEPDVYLMQISHDGSILVTVDSWQPPATDFDFLARDELLSNGHAQLHREINLKFWHWNEAKQIWMLQTRISNPHPRSNIVEPGRVIDLAVDPRRQCFYTIGDDHVIKGWASRRASKSDEWICKSLARLPSQNVSTMNATAGTLSGALAVSGDASFVAATISDRDATSSQVHLLNFPLSSITYSLPPSSGRIHSLSIHDRHLITLSSNNLSVLDLPLLKTIFNTSLTPPQPNNPLSRRHRHLAVPASPSASTPPSNLVAISVPLHAPERTKIEVWDFKQGKCKFRTKIAGIVTGLFAMPRSEAMGGREEWVIMTGDARVYRITAPGRRSGRRGELCSEATIESAGGATGGEQVTQQEIMIVDDDAEDIEMDLGTSDARDEAEADVQPIADRPVIRPEQLAALFEGPRGSLLNMPVRNMFEGVMGLFAGRVAKA